MSQTVSKAEIKAGKKKNELLETIIVIVEALIIARDLGYRIDEVPIRWAHQEGSKVSLLRDGPRMLRDLVKIRLRGKKARLRVRES